MKQAFTRRVVSGFDEVTALPLGGNVSATIDHLETVLKRVASLDIDPTLEPSREKAIEILSVAIHNLLVLLLAQATSAAQTQGAPHEVA